MSASLKEKELKARKLRAQSAIADLELKIEQEMVNIQRLQDHIKLQESEIAKIDAEMKGESNV